MEPMRSGGGSWLGFWVASVFEDRDAWQNVPWCLLINLAIRKCQLEFVNLFFRYLCSAEP